MTHAQSVNTIPDGFPYPTLPKHPGKPDHASIQDNHRLLTANVASIESPRGGEHNGHLGLVMTATRYALMIQVPSVRPTDPGRTPNIRLWMTPFDKKALLRKHAKHRRQYNKCCNVDNALHNQLLTAFGDTYLLPLKNSFMGYSGATTLQLLGHLYAHYARILATDLAENEKKLGEAYNPDEPLESLFTRLNEYVDYATMAGEPIT